MADYPENRVRPPRTPKSTKTARDFRMPWMVCPRARGDAASPETTIGPGSGLPPCARRRRNRRRLDLSFTGFAPVRADRRGICFYGKSKYRGLPRIGAFYNRYRKSGFAPHARTVRRVGGAKFQAGKIPQDDPHTRGDAVTAFQTSRRRDLLSGYFSSSNEFSGSHRRPSQCRRPSSW
jgi:hypothetical protein